MSTKAIENLERVSVGRDGLGGAYRHSFYNDLSKCVARKF